MFGTVPIISRTPLPRRLQIFYSVHIMTQGIVHSTVLACGVDVQRFLDQRGTVVHFSTQNG